MLFHVLFHGTHALQYYLLHSRVIISPRSPWGWKFLSPGALLQLGKHPGVPEPFYPMSTPSHVLQRAALHPPMFWQGAPRTVLAHLGTSWLDTPSPALSSPSTLPARSNDSRIW